MFRARSYLSAAMAAICAGVFYPTPATACTPVDFFDMDISGSLVGPVVAALQMAYGDVQVGGTPPEVHLPGGSALPLGTVRGISPKAALLEPTIAEQFRYQYPLEFDLTSRNRAFNDPGRLRNSDFFEVLYFSDSAEARSTLRDIGFGRLGTGSFQVTRKHGVDCQLEAVLAQLQGMEQDFTPFFMSPGGSFNWRRISGTARLSAHSFGIAVDLNSALGGYWLWSGAREGEVGAYDNKIPEALVQTFERYGFIWGGKWHHYDGMHFEYRPELILHSRMLEEGKQP